MQFNQKTQNILNKLEETKFAMFGGDKQKATRFLERTLSAFPEYANTVIREQIMVPLWKQRCDTEEFKENVKNIDTHRHYAHESAISSFNMLNRMSQKLELPPFTEIDTKDRHAVADEVGKFIAEYYATGTATTMLGVTKDRKTDYRIERISETFKNKPEDEFEID